MPAKLPPGAVLESDSPSLPPGAVLEVGTSADDSSQKPKSTNWFGFQDAADQSLADFSKHRSPEDIHRRFQQNGWKEAPGAAGRGNAQVETTFENVGSRAVAGLASMAVHPLNTIKGAYDTGKEVLSYALPMSREERFDKMAADTGPIAQRIREFQEEYARSPREAIENASGDLLGMYLSGKLLDAAGKPIKVIGGKGMDALRTTREGMRKGAQSMVGAGDRVIKGKVEDEAISGEGAYQKSKKASQKNTEDTLEARAKIRQDRIEELKKQREEQRGHQTKVEDTKAENTEALRAQSKIEPTQEKLKSAGRELQAQIETARNNALKEGNSKYGTVNEKLSPLPADMEAVHTMYADSNSALGETQTEPAILKRLGKSIEQGESLSYKDLQAMYSELGKELSKGTLDGRVYHAYDLLHEGIGADMQRIADSQGMGEQLTDARSYWRRMKQAFGKPYNPTDVANATLDKATGQGAEEDQANRVRLLGSFDKTIPQTVDHITNLRKGADSLPAAKPIRDVVKPLPTAPETAKLPEYGEPKGSVPFEKPNVDTRAIREKLLDRWTSGESQLSKFQVRSLIGGGLGAIVGGIFEGKVGAGVGGMVGSAFGPAAIAKVVEMPAVREWLTRPPTGELETLKNLPYADRIQLTDGLKKVAAKAQSEGVPVSPALLKAIGATAALPKTQQLQDTRDAQRQTTQQ